MKKSRGGRVFCVAALLLTSLVSTSYAQTSRGTLTGIVTDSSGAVISKAAVTITQEGTNVKRQTTTNEAGVYRFDAVDLGTYSLTVQSIGFRTSDTKGVVIQAAHTTDIDVRLDVGETSQTVTVEASAFEVALQTSEQVRGADFSDRTVETLPFQALDSLTVTQLLPGVVTANQGQGSNINEDGTFAYSVNGQRPRGNNFMIDGVENNDISIAGPAFTIKNPDSVEEVNIQTANFSAEFGRAGGAVINQITKSGTNSLHGTATYIYTGNAFDALSNVQKIGGLTATPRAVENIPDFTIGGPVVIPHLYNGHDKTFFFAAAQWDRRFDDVTSPSPLPLPTATGPNPGVATLQTLAAAGCANAALYLKVLGSLAGDPTKSPSSISLAAPSATGTCNNSTRAGMVLNTGLFVREQSHSALDNNHLVRIDHQVSNKQNMSFRWLYDSNVTGPTLHNLPGFDNNFTGLTLTGNFTDTYVINSRFTNEFRFNYGRIGFNFPLAAPDQFHATLAAYTISQVAGFGGATNIPQFRFANNWQYQDTMSYVRGRHTFRYGVDFLRQLARQRPPFNERGSFTYAKSGAVTAFSNFLDDFGGSGGNLNRQFGSPIYHPNLFRQSYFFQDSWKTTQNLTLNLGLRYENFGTPVNTFAVAAFTNYDPVNFAAPHKVPGDNNNFAPTVGFAWNPQGQNLIDRLMGGKHMVWRGGFQTSYDTWFNNLLSNIAGTSPNTLGGIIPSVVSATDPRGLANFSAQFAGIQPTPPTAQSPQSNLFLLPFRNPYTDRWSLGFEREMPYGLIWDTSYVGSVSHKLFRSIDMNPIVDPTTGARFMPQVGSRTARATSANSNYESLQVELKRPFKSTPVGDLQFNGSYTYAHYLDEISDVFGFDSTPSSFESVSQVVGVSPHLDYGNSDFDRRHVGAIGLVWGLRGPRQGLLGSLVGGWQLSAISTWQTGIPFTIANGTDRNGDGQRIPDRPDIGNASAPITTRATLNASCSTGYSNPDLAGTPCVSPTSVHWLEGNGLPNSNTVGRNTLTLPGLDNLDLAVAKTFRFTESKNLELRLDMFNALNTLDLGYTTPGVDFGQAVVDATGRFLNQALTPDNPRTMRVLARFSF